MSREPQCPGLRGSHCRRTFSEALDLIRERLPFPGIIGRICAHPCEEVCLRGRKVEQPIAICALKRFVADFEKGKREMPVPETGPDKGKKLPSSAAALRV